MAEYTQLTDSSFSQPVEAGAEFIHGDLPLTLSLLNEAGISYHAINDKMYRLEKGKLKKENDFTEHWNILDEANGFIKARHDIKSIF